MQILFDDVIAVAFHSFWLRSGDGYSDDFGRGGQENGLCGAAEPGMLAFTTGLHTGDVPVRMELHDREPALQSVWQEVVGGAIYAGQFGDGAGPVGRPDLSAGVG